MLNLADYGRLRIMADVLGVDTIDRDGATVVLRFRPQTKLDPLKLVALVRQRPDLALVPPSSLRLSLQAPSTKGDRASVSGGPSPSTRVKKGSARAHIAPSWWTARAREGEVRSGFTKEAMLKPAKDDPRAPGGVFEQLGGLLSELLGRE